MQRSTLLLGLMSLGALVGCQDNDLNVPAIPTTTTLVYSPALGDIPVPNDVLFKDTIDATLNFPPASSPSQQPLFDALNSLDGWSTTAPISFHFDESIDALTVVAEDSVRVFEVNVATNPATGLKIGTPVTGVVAELTSPADYVVAAAASDPTGATFAIVPTQPLKPATAYMVVVTNGVEDDAGDAVTFSSEYGLARVSIATNPYPSNHPLAGLQVLVNAMEAVADGAGVPAASIVCSFSFTTQDTTTVLGTARSVALGGEAAVLAGIAAAFPGHPAGTDAPANTVPTATVNPTSIFDTLGNQGDLYVGELTLPYYLTGAANATFDTVVTDTAPLLEYWHARYTFPFGIDTEANVSRYNPLPLQSTAEIIPMLISMPDEAVTGLTKPASGWPVVIYQHGITSDRSSLLGIADRLNMAGYAVVAIDLPLHGLTDFASDPLGGLLFTGYQDGGVRERTFGLDNVNNTTSLLGGDTIADSSGAHFINLSSLRTQRDNLRQAAADLFALKKVLADNLEVDGVVDDDLDGTDVHFVGISLGSIVGTSFAALEPSLSTVSLNVPGAGIPRFLEASPAFGPTVIGDLALAGVIQGTPEFDQFMWAAQTATDTSDPLNYLVPLVLTGTPILLQEVVGGGPVAGPGGLFNLPDQVIPNSVAGAPLSGTEPMIGLLGLTAVTVAGPTPTSAGVVRFSQGAHSSLLQASPDVDGDGTPEVDGSLAAANAEMQNEIVDWMDDAGTQVTVSDVSVVQP